MEEETSALFTSAVTLFSSVSRSGMSLLKADMNLETLGECELVSSPVSESAPAMEVTTSITSSWASAQANAATTLARTTLRAIARINLNVLLGEIARPETRASLGPAVDRESNGTIGFVEFFLQFALRKVSGQSAPADGYALQIDVHLRGIQRHARITGGRNDA